MAGWRDEAEVVEDAPTGWRASAEPTEEDYREIPLHETALAHGTQGLAMGATPKLRGLYAAGEGTGAESGNPLVTAMDVITGLYRKVTGDPEAEKRYEAARESEKAYLKETGEANPKTAFVSNVVGGAAPAAAVGALAPVVRGAGLLPKVATGVSQGAAVGLGYGLGSGDDAGDVAASTAMGGLAGGALPLAAEGARMTLSPVAARIRQALSVTPTPAARALEAQGVTGLTVGQKAGPESFLGQLEAVSTHNPLGMQAEREAAKEAFQRVAQNKGVAPGAQPPASTDLQGRLKEIFEGFGPVYDKVRNQPIPPEAISSLPSAASMPGRGVDARTAAGVKAEVENALTVLGIKPSGGGHAHGHGAAPAKPQGLVDQFGRDIPPPPPPLPKAKAGDLLKVREGIREQIRAARQAQDFDKLRLLNEAEDVVTGALEQGLTPESAQLLRDADRQYARLMTAANAAPAGQTNFTPLQYLKQVEKGSGRRAFKAGGAGDLQDLGEAARQTFVDAPLTGFRGAVLSSVPGMSYVASPLMRWLNTDAGKRFLFANGPTGGQAARVSPEMAAFIEMLAARRRPQVDFSPAAAEEDPR